MCVCIVVIVKVYIVLCVCVRERESVCVCVCVYYSVTRLYADFVKERSQSDYLVSQTKRYVSDSDRFKYWFLK